MFKRKKLSTSEISTISTTSENLAITNLVTSDVTSSMPAIASPVLSEIENVENSITPADVSKLPVAKSPTVTSSLESGKQSSDDALPTAIDDLFQPRAPKFNFPLRSFNNGKKKNVSTVIGSKIKTGNPGYTTTQKKMQRFVQPV